MKRIFALKYTGATLSGRRGFTTDEPLPNGTTLTGVLSEASDDAPVFAYGQGMTLTEARRLDKTFLSMGMIGQVCMAEVDADAPPNFEIFVEMRISERRGNSRPTGNDVRGSRGRRSADT